MKSMVIHIVPIGKQIEHVYEGLNGYEGVPTKVHLLHSPNGKNASQKLKLLSKDENFIYNGYIEGNNIMDGKSNVIVTDGFTGNIALKTAEGTASFITRNLKESLTENFITKISLIFSYFSLKRFKEKLDPRKYNGAIFLGLNGPVVKSHGSTDSVGFYHSIDLCYRIIKGNLMEQIRNNLNHLNVRD